MSSEEEKIKGKEKLFSIIVPCHNSFQYLVNCYRSLVNQTIEMEKIEIIFVDDASTDNTFLLLCEIEKQFPESIMVIRLDKNMRQGGARNVGLQYASGRYISFVDSDDWLDEEMYSKLAEIIEECEPDIIKFSHDVVSESGIQLKTVQQNIAGLYELRDIEARRNLLLSEVLDYGCWNKVYKREVIEHVGVQFAEHVVYEEPKFTYPLYFYIQNFYLLDEILYHYTFNRNGTMQKEIKIDKKLYNHLEVQAQTYEFVYKHLDREMLNCYKEEIEAYFIKSYFCETILFAGWGNLLLETTILEEMKKWLLSKFPEYKSNTYVQKIFSDSHKQALTALEMEFTQESLVEFCALCSK